MGSRSRRIRLQHGIPRTRSPHIYRRRKRETNPVQQKDSVTRWEPSNQEPSLSPKATKPNCRSSQQGTEGFGDKMGTLEPAVSPGKPTPKYQVQAPARQTVSHDCVTGRMSGRVTVHGPVPHRERERSPQARADGENDRVAAYPRPPARAPVRVPARAVVGDVTPAGSAAAAAHVCSQFSACTTLWFPARRPPARRGRRGGASWCHRPGHSPCCPAYTAAAAMTANVADAATMTAALVRRCAGRWAP